MDTAPTPRTDPGSPSGAGSARLLGLLPYLLGGVAFGFVAMRSEIVSWYRIQEMFRFHSFHMYGVIGSAVLVGTLSLLLLRAIDARAVDGSRIQLPAKEPRWRGSVLGGITFGLGWALVGACPGPIYALIGAGLPAFLVVLGGALAGTWSYGLARGRLPH